MNSTGSPGPHGINAQNAIPGAGSSGGAPPGAKDRSRDLSTAKTAQSTPQNTNPNANRTIGHYVVGKFFFQIMENI